MYRLNKRGGYSPRNSNRRNRANRGSEGRMNNNSVNSEAMFYQQYLSSLQMKRANLKQKRKEISRQKDVLNGVDRSEMYTGRNSNELLSIDTKMERPIIFNSSNGKPEYISPKKYLLNYQSAEPVNSNNDNNNNIINRMSSSSSSQSTATVSSSKYTTTENKDYIIENLKRQLEKEKEITALMRTSLIEVQNQKLELENNSQQSRDQLKSTLRVAEAKVNGFETILDENRQLKLEISNQQTLIEKLYSQLRKNAEAKGTHEGQLKVNQYNNIRMLKTFEIENANLKQLLEVATQEKLEAQNQADLDRQDLLDSRDIIVSLREAVKEAQKLNNNNNNKKVKLNNEDSNYKMLDAENTKLNNENNKLRNELQMLEIEQMKLLEDAQKDAVTIKNYQNQERHSFLN